MQILKANGLVKSFGRRRVVDGVTLEVNQGEIVGILGPNGAGKTTTFRMICGMLTPDRGQVFLRNQDVTEWPMYIRAREGGMGYLPQQSSVFAKLTTEQNLIAMMQLLNMNRREQRERCEQLLEQFNITHIRKSRGGKLSGGERRRLEIARCLVSNPEIIMLDEPFAGIDPVTVQSVQEIIKQLSARGISILITDHAGAGNFADYRSNLCRIGRQPLGEWNDRGDHSPYGSQGKVLGRNRYPIESVAQAEIGRREINSTSTDRRAKFSPLNRLKPLESARSATLRFFDDTFLTSWSRTF